MMFRLTQSLRQSRASASLHLSCLVNSNKIGTNYHKVKKLEKRALVWTGKYKSIEDVPDMLPSETLDKARNKLRIRISNLMMALTLLACVGFIISGKRAHERGESIEKQNLDWHKSHKD